MLSDDALCRIIDTAIIETMPLDTSWLVGLNVIVNPDNVQEHAIIMEITPPVAPFCFSGAQISQCIGTFL